MKQTSSNALMIFVFAILCGGAYHYKFVSKQGRVAQPLAVGPRIQEPVKAGGQSPEASPAKTSQLADKASKAGGAAQGPAEKPAAPSAEAQSTAQDGAGSREAQARLAVAEKALAGVGETRMRAILELEQLAWAEEGNEVGQQARMQLSGVVAEGVAKGQKAAAKSKWLEARAAYSEAFFASWDKKERDAHYVTLQGVNAKLLRSRDKSVQQAAGLAYYTVKPGDSLGAIARKNKTSWRLLKRINKLKSTVIRVGQKLRVLTGQVAIDISKFRFELVMTVNAQVFLRFYVAIGKDDRTPVGRFTVEERLIKPTWYGPDGVYAFGHEKNVLGTRWMGFNRTEDCSGFGIHGTKFPESIGTKASMGCIRMRNAEVEHLFDYVPKGCVVSIRH